MTHDDNRFAAWLEHRRYEPPSPDFAERILARARTTDQKAAFDLLEWLNRLFADLSPARPAYALASVLLLGIVIGYGNAPAAMNDEDDTTPSFQALLSDEGELL